MFVLPFGSIILGCGLSTTQLSNRTKSSAAIAFAGDFIFTGVRGNMIIFFNLAN
jgi:hypothetical protein